MLPAIICSLCLPAAPDAPPANLRDVLGVVHVAGAYDATSGRTDFLNAGAETLLELGTRTIKIWFTRPQTSYPYHSNWPDHFDSLAAMAEHPHYKTLFEKPFSTIILLVYSLGRPEHYFRDGVSDAQAADETHQFKELAAHLFHTFRGSGKTFILQHWEGDWAIRGSYDKEQTPTPKAIAGMIRWLNARQDGVDAARQAAGPGAGVRVFHAAEVNLVQRAMELGQPNVTNAVLPHTHLDLVSYSCWDTGPRGPLFREALDYIARHMPDRPPFGARNVYIGEYGWPEADAGVEKVQRTVKNVVDTGLDWGCPYLLYWQLYCNEAVNKPVAANTDVRGYWLIKPDGAKAWAWRYFQNQLKTAR